MKARIRRAGPSRAAPRLRWIVHLPKHFPNMAAGSLRETLVPSLRWISPGPRSKAKDNPWSLTRFARTRRLSRSSWVVVQARQAKRTCINVAEISRRCRNRMGRTRVPSQGNPRWRSTCVHAVPPSPTSPGSVKGRGAGAGQSGSVRVRQFSLPGNWAHRQLAHVSTFVSCPPVRDRREVKAASTACLPSTRRRPARASPAGCSSPGTRADGPRRSCRSRFHRRW